MLPVLGNGRFRFLSLDLLAEVLAHFRPFGVVVDFHSIILRKGAITKHLTSHEKIQNLINIATHSFL